MIQLSQSMIVLLITGYENSLETQLSVITLLLHRSCEPWQAQLKSKTTHTPFNLDSIVENHRVNPTGSLVTRS